MFKTVLQSIGVSLASVGIGFVISILLARFLGPEQRGIYGSLLTIAILIAGFSQFGLAQGYVFYKRKLKGSGVRVLAQSIGLISFGAIIMMLVGHNYFLAEELLPYANLLCLLTLATVWHQFFQSASQVDSKLYFYNLLKMTLPALNLCAIAFYYGYFGELTTRAATSILLISTSFSALCLAWSIFAFESRIKESLTLKLHAIIPYSSKIYGTSLLGILLQSLDKLIVLGVGSMREFGLYSVAFGLSRLIGIVPETLSTVIFSRFAGQDEKQLSVVTKHVFALIFPCLMLICLTFAFIAPWLIVFLFGQDYADAALPFTLLAFESAISSLGWLLSQRFNAAGRPGLVFIRQAISIIPLLLILVFIDSFPLLVLVSSVLLLSSILRLIVTFVLYKTVFNESAPSLFLSLSEIKMFVAILKDKRAN